MEDIRPHQCGDVRPVVDREHFPVLLRHRGQDLQRGDLVAGVDGLVAQLHDVYPALVGGVEEVP